MSARARAALGERDANHAEITKRYEANMCSVFDCSRLGNSFPDILVRIPTRRGPVLALVEVKTEDGDLSLGQARFLRDWGESCVAVVRNIGDVDAHLVRVRDKFK